MSTPIIDDKKELPTVGTEAARKYFQAYIEDFRFFHFIIDTVITGDYVAHIAEQALNNIDNKEKVEKINPAELARKKPGTRTQFLRKNNQPLLEMFLTRAVDNFETYLVDLIRIVLHAKPEILSESQRTITVEEILQYQRIEDFLHDLIERKVNALSYDGFAELQTWCERRGIEIPVAEDKIPMVIELIATRNAIAHNRGTVDERYVRTVKDTRFIVGQKRDLEVDNLFDALKIFHQIVNDTDEKSVQKFAIPTVQFQKPPMLANKNASGGK